MSSWTNASNWSYCVAGHGRQRSLLRQASGDRSGDVLPYFGDGVVDLSVLDGLSQEATEAESR